MVLSEAIISAAYDGDLATIQEWLAGGGDPDDRGGPGLHSGDTMLHVLAGAGPDFGFSGRGNERNRLAITSALLAAGATVDAISEPHKNTPLLTAAIFGRPDMAQLLCQAGANVNYIRPSIYEDHPGDFPLVLCLQYPDLVRVLLHFGADPSMKCKRLTAARSLENWVMILPEEKAFHKALQEADRQYGRDIEYHESARILRDARLLRPRLRGVFALRALVHRGRATPTSETPEGFALLFFAPTSRPRTRAARRRALPGLPDPLAHLVCKFWLGEPPRRCSAAPATE